MKPRPRWSSPADRQSGSRKTSAGPGSSFPDTTLRQPARTRGGGENRCAGREETASLIKACVKEFGPPTPAFLAASSDTACHRESLPVLRGPSEFGECFFRRTARRESTFFISRATPALPGFGAEDPAEAHGRG